MTTSQNGAVCNLFLTDPRSYISNTALHICSLKRMGSSHVISLYHLREYTQKCCGRELQTLSSALVGYTSTGT